MASRRHEHALQAHGPERKRESERSTGRHALVAALNDALAGLMPASQSASAAATSAGDAPASGSAVSAEERKHALHEFMHELLGALRPTGGEGGAKGHHGRGFAWGRTSEGDLARRLDALAQRLGGTAPKPVPTDTPLPVPSTDAVAQPVPQAAPGSATLVADTPLLTAFKHLAAALNGGAGEGDGKAAPADQLAALLHQMAQALQADPVAEAPASGSLIDVSV